MKNEKSKNYQRFPNILEKETLIAALAYLALTLITFWPILLAPAHILPAINMTTKQYLGGPLADVYASLWNLWWTNYSTFTNPTFPYFTSMLFYPFGANILGQTLNPIANLITIPLQSISLAFAYNAIIVSSFVLSGLFTYFLALYLTKERLPSFIAGLIFAFSAVNIAHAHIFLDWTAVEWIPLFTLFLLLVIKTYENKYMIGTAASFVMVSFMGNLEEGIITALFALSILYFGIFSGWKEEIFNKKMLASLIKIAIFTTVIGAPFIFPILQGILFSNITPVLLSSTGSLSSIFVSDPIMSFFIPSPFNGIFSGMVSQFQDSLFPLNFSWEDESYIGYSVIFLLIVAVYYDFRKEKMSNTLVWISVAVAFVLLSLGPLIKIFGTPTQIPGPYLIYMFIPILDTVRGPGRFDLVVTLCFALVSAFGLKYILEIKKFGIWKNRIIVTSILSAVIFVECAGFPTSQSFISQYYLNATIPKGYYLINSSMNSSVMILPTSQVPRLMYYQSLFKTPVIGGYISRQSLVQTEYTKYMPITLNDTGYLISENDTNANLMAFSIYSIRYVSVLKKMYNSTAFSLISSDLGRTGNIIYNDNSTEIYYLPQVNFSSPNGTALASGSWHYGTFSSVLGIQYFGVLSSSFNNATSRRNMWILFPGSNITVYSPKNQSAALCVNETAISTVSLGLYANTTLIKNATIGPGNGTYSATLSLKNGYNIFGFAPKASAAGPQIGFTRMRLLYGRASCQ